MEVGHRKMGELLIFRKSEKLARVREAGVVRRVEAVATLLAFSVFLDMSGPGLR